MENHILRENPMKKKNQGFTLAEIMIVLTVIGILSVILLPVAFNSTPDKNILKFKKFHNDFATIIRELVSSGVYYMPGDLSKKPDGTDVPADTTTATERNYFINAIADIMPTKDVTYTTSTNTTNARIILSSFASQSNNDKPVSLEDICQSHPEKSTAYDIVNRIRTNNGIYIWELSPMVKYENSIDENGFDGYYKIICVDIDGPEGPTRRFSYGIRKDGKMIFGPRARWWLERNINKKENDCCPKYVSASTVSDPNASIVNYCDTNDTICP